MHIIPEELTGQTILCGICLDSTGTLISPHENDDETDSSHLFHFGCLALAIQQTRSKNTCPSCLQTLSLNVANQKLIDSPDTLFIAACKAGATKLIIDLVKKHSFQKMTIAAGFACATYVGHKNVVELLFQNSYMAYGSNIVCLEIALQQQNFDMAKYWSRLCKNSEINFDYRVTTEYLNLDAYKHFNKENRNEMYNSATCFFKAVRLGNHEIALHIAQSFEYLTVWKRFKYRWQGELYVYEKFCLAGLWGNLELIKLMVAKGFYLDLYHNLALTCAHFMGHREVELYLKSKGCQLETESVFYKLADACANASMSNLKRYISTWAKHARKLGYDITLSLMLILLIRSGNVPMLDYLLSKSRPVITSGILHAYEYAVQLKSLPIICIFMDKFSGLAYYAIAYGCYLNDAKMVEEGLNRCPSNALYKAKMRIFHYGMIYQNPKLLASMESTAQLSYSEIIKKFL